MPSPFRRLMAGALIASQSLLTFPVQTLLASTQDGSTATPPPVQVQVNRTTPERGNPSEVPSFSSTPTVREISGTRLLPEALLPVGSPTASDTAALAAMLAQMPGEPSDIRLSRVARFMESHPTSAWQPSLLVNAGLLLLRDGFQTRAAVDFRAAWELAKNDSTPLGTAVADRAIGQLLTMESRLGHAAVLEKLLQEVGSRELTGKATEQLTAAKQALWVMQNAPSEAFRCGPYALAQVLNAIRPSSAGTKLLTTKTGPRGMSLNALAQLAINNGHDVLVVRRESGTEFPIPAVVHMKSDHFAAVIRHEGNRYLVRDAMEPSGDSWVLDTALAEEASGAALARAGPIPDGWRAMTATEADQVWGRGYATAPPPPPGSSSPPTPPCACGGGKGMATYQVHLLEVSLHLFDTPVGYTPPVGPAVQFRLDYNQRESTQPQTFLYSNLGQRWTFDWLSYVTDDPANPFATVAVFRRGGGEDIYTINVQTGEYNQNTRERLQLVRTSSTPVTYELRMPDGSKEVFAQSDGSSVYPRRVFMTQSYDPQGNVATFTYDSQLRLIAVTDAIGQVTTLSYGLPQDIWKITSVTDPFGRTAALTYDSAGRLQSITDVIQLWSKFTYAADGFITSLTTPYGTSRFTKSDSGLNRVVEMTDPMGGKERVEYRATDDASFAQDPAGTVPSIAGASFNNDFLQYRNTLYWDRKAMADAPGDRTKAHIIHWVHAKGNINQAVSILESEKKALENRVWYIYPNQAGSIWEGDGRQPSVTARILDDGTTQAYKAEYNSLGQITKRTDPLGRETVYEYDTNGIDLLRVKQKNGSGYDLLETRTYNTQHEPLIVTDASGQPTTYTYNAAGQIATIMNAKNETTTYTYTSGQLTGITGPVSGATTTFTYDDFGRLRSSTDADGYTETTDYDAFDRAVQTTYPDGTFDQTQYRFLDVARRRDRLGRWTTFTYDGMRRQTSVRDPLGRVVRQEWCTCGSLDALIDANGNRTSWQRDVQARVTKETRANWSFTTFVYEAMTSRLKKVTDPRLQDTTYAYFADNQLQQTTYTNAQIATASVSFTYDPVYPRIASMVDGVGTTVYGYHAILSPPARGATRLASVDGPFANDTLTYEYDELGRVATRAINGVANTVTWTFDALGRTTTEQNSLGTFTYTYDGPMGRVATVTYPNAQTSTYAYYRNTADRRLQTIHHKYPNGSTLSKFEYTYDAVGNIMTWRQQADVTAVSWTYDYDAADQLTSAIKSTTDPTPAVLQRYAYGYDPAGNRTVEQLDDAVMGATYNNMNQVVSHEAAGALWLEGTISEPATVTLGGNVLDVSAANRFHGSTPIVAGTTPFAIAATDVNGNSATRAYEVDSAGAGKAFTFDANGNLISDGSRTFEWDARNQLVGVNNGIHRTEFQYNGARRLIVAIEKENGVVQSENRQIWCGLELCEERDSANGVTSSRFISAAMVSGNAYSLSRDHSGSVRDVTDAAGTRVSRHEYDPFGRMTTSGSNVIPSGGFAGLLRHAPSGLLQAVYRSYDVDLGRWLSPDPIGLAGGDNLYAYVLNARSISLI